MTTLVVTVFLLVYFGMIFGGLPFLQLDRTGIALLGAIVLVASQALSVDEAFRSLHAPTLILLFAFMVISAQLRMSGFYAWVARRVGALAVGPAALLGIVIVVAAYLSAVFSNDVVCLAMAPVLADICRARRLKPIPFLIGLACAANIGSAATLIGNPQNMLIGQTLALSFGGYLSDTAVPVALSLGASWALIVCLRRGHGWHVDAGSVDGIIGNTATTPAAGQRADDDSAALAASADTQLDRWQTAKGLAVAGALFLCFLLAPWPRDLMALAGAGLLLTSRRLHSQRMLGLVDWQLLILFMGLFVVNHAMQQTGLPARCVAELASAGFDLHLPAPLFAASFALSNLVSNVPAVMLLLPTTAGAHAGTLLALSSTLAGNLLIIGSIANLIVVGAAERQGIRIDWREHARLGVPITVATLLIAALYLALLA